MQDSKGAPRPDVNRRKVRLLAAAAVTGLLALAGCGSGSGASPGVASVSSPDGSSTFSGTQLPQPVTLTASSSSAEFSSTAGGTTTLAALQRGHVMLVYFGYTHCPDVCPTTMADLGIALREATPAVQKRTQVVFVTSDPQRDTVAVMSSWLAHFDTGLATPFVGLTASLDQIDAVAKSVGVPLEPPVVAANGTVTVEHGAQTLAFVGGKADLLWLADTDPAAYRHDIERLARS